MQQRSIAGLFAATAIGSAGLAAGGTEGPLLVRHISGSEAAAGWPIGVLVAGSATAVLLISRATGRLGRVRSLVIGYATGLVGAVVVLVASVLESVPLVLVGSFLLGSASAAVFFTRYAAAELGGEGARGRGLGLVFFATAVGATIGPTLLGPSGDLARSLGLPRLAGLYLVSVPAFTIAGVVLLALSRTPGTRQPKGPVGFREVAAGVATSSGRSALAMLAVANLLMVGVMTIAPVTLHEHGHDLRVVGLVVSLHVAGMFGPSPLSGWLADRVGPRAVGAIGFALIASSGVAGGLVDEASVGGMTLVLVLLGTGWNFGVVAGSSLLATSTPASVRAEAEGIGDVAMSGAAAVGAPAAGLVAGLGDYRTLSIVATLVAVGALVVVRRAQPTRAVVEG
jgi:MFS family permease